MSDLLFSVFVGFWLAAVVGLGLVVVRGSGSKSGKNLVVALPFSGLAKWLGYGGPYPPPSAPVVIVRRGRGNTYGAEFSLMMAASYLENVVAWRRIGIEGRLGGGKTLMSVVMAKWLYEHEHVRGVFSNFPIDPKYIPYVPSCVNTAVILDEGAEWADARDSAKGSKGYGKYFRKLGSYLFSPSVDAVDRRMRHVTVERNLDLFMLGWWLYNWKDPKGLKGWFILAGFESVFNKYDHRFIPADDGGILDTMKEEIAQLAGSQRKILVVGGEDVVLENPYANPLELGDGRTVN